MATRPDPLDMARRGEPLLRHIVAVEERTPYHLTGIGGVVVAIERAAGDRAHAIGADHDLRLDLSAIGESENDTVASLLQSGQAMSRMNGAVIEPAGERVEEVGAVKAVIGSAVPSRSLVPIVEFEELAGLHIARVDSGRCGPDRGDFVAKVDRLQCFKGLRTYVDRGADLAQSGSGLEHLRPHPEGPQRMRGRKPGKPAADNRYRTA